MFFYYSTAGKSSNTILLRNIFRIWKTNIEIWKSNLLWLEMDCESFQSFTNYQEKLPVLIFEK